MTPIIVLFRSCFNCLIVSYYLDVFAYATMSTSVTAIIAGFAYDWQRNRFRGKHDTWLLYLSLKSFCDAVTDKHQYFLFMCLLLYNKCTTFVSYFDQLQLETEISL